MPICHPISFFGEVSVQILCSFLNWIVFSLSCKNLMNMYVSPLTDMCSTNIFSQFMACLFIFRLEGGRAVFHFGEVQVGLHFFLLWFMLFSMLYKHFVSITQDYKDFSLCFFPRNFTSLDF